MERNLSLEDIREKHRYDKKLKRFSNKHYFNDNRIYGSINSNLDVERANNYLENSLEQYKGIYPLVNEDIEELEKAMGRYEIAIRKVIACLDTPNTDFNYNAEQLQELIDSVFEKHEKVDKLRQRKLFQD